MYGCPKAETLGALPGSAALTASGPSPAGGGSGAEGEESGRHGAVGSKIGRAHV